LDDAAKAVYNYDDNGNLIYKSQDGSSFYYEYDYENRLVKVTKDGDMVAAYTYNGEGKRIVSTEKGVTTYYLYDGNNAVIERDSQGQTTAHYTRGLAISGGIGGIVSRRAGTVSYYHYDALGNVVNLTDSSGNTIISYTYDAFGNVLSQSGSSANPYQFSTKECNAEIGLTYFGARYYDPRIGRFITPDPLGFIDGPNLYVYVNNNPVNLIDPWGLCGEKDKWGPEWLEKLVPRYENYGGPGHTDPTFKTEPADTMDELFMQHDWLWIHGKWRQSNTILLMDLLNLPFNPNRWERKPKDIGRAILYREGAIVVFWCWNIFADDRN
jgi:RHS repeat-associated protein